MGEHVRQPVIVNQYHVIVWKRVLQGLSQYMLWEQARVSVKKVNLKNNNKNYINDKPEVIDKSVRLISQSLRI